MYQGQPPWDIAGPQPAFVHVESTGGLTGAVLDLGCGTGENALYLASHGHEVWGVDFSPAAIERACRKANERGLRVHFEVRDALDLNGLSREFDTAIDSGLFHVFSDAERTRFTAGLAKVLRPGGVYFMLCFSDLEPDGEGPRRVTQQEIRDTFRDGWEVKSIVPSRFKVVESADGPRFSPGGPKAWLATIVRDVK
jgi:cyclopropane fatty-acyl-phospholipid synthase-like methyltransferase